MSQTVTVSYLLSSLSTTSTVSFKITQIGHANGGYLHLNKNKFTDSQSADNDVGAEISNHSTGDWTMSETVVSRITSRGGDFLLDAAEPGQMVQIQQFEYSSVFQDTDSLNKEKLMPGVFGSGAMKLTCSAGNRLHITCQMQVGQNSTWRQIFFRNYWNGGETPAPSGYIIGSHLAAGGSAGEE